MTEHTDNPQQDDEQPTGVIDRQSPAPQDFGGRDWDEPKEDDWNELDDGELSPRPRNRLLRPLPMGLIALLIATLGFLGGVLVQKGSGGGGSSAASPFGGGGIPSALSGKGGAGGSSSGFPALGGSGKGPAVTGTVSSVNGKTLYVKSSEGGVFAVKAEAGSTVSRTSKVEAKAIHPGDSVVVQGSRHGSKVTASSISATAKGVEGAGLSSIFSSGAGAGTHSTTGSSSAVESLFSK